MTLTKTGRALLITLILLAAGAPLTAQDKDKQADKKIEARVDGLSCPFCAYGLEQKLKALTAIERLDIDINEGHIQIFLKKGRTVNPDEIREKVAEAGFTLRTLIIDGKEIKMDTKEKN